MNSLEFHSIYENLHCLYERSQILALSKAVIYIHQKLKNYHQRVTKVEKTAFQVSTPRVKCIFQKRPRQVIATRRKESKNKEKLEKMPQMQTVGKLKENYRPCKWQLRLHRLLQKRQPGQLITRHFEKSMYTQK